MNGLKSTDEAVECPLCMEPLEVDDLNFFPCTCGYQICRFCWHRIRTDENELCPACRKEYPENPADFTPLTQEEMIAFKSQKRQRDQQRKQKVTENRKHLANVRVVQKNLVFVVGLPPRLADADILKKHEYFGKYGKIHKVVINPSTAYAGVQGPSASAYVTYVHNSDALRAIQSVNNIMIDGRLIKTSLGTTKYCSHFMKNQQCPKGDCMYLHELGDSEASFTKEEMHQGKHQEYEKRLHDSLIAASGSLGNSGSCSNAGTIGIGSFSTCTANSSKNADCNKIANSCSTAALPLVIQTPSSSSSSPSTNVTPSSVAPQQRDAWPSLSISPVNFKEAASGGQGNGRNKKDKLKNDKSRSSKNTRNNSSQYVTSINKDSSYSHSQGGKERNAGPVLSSELPATALFLETRSDFNKSNRSKTEKQKEKTATSRNTRQIQKQREKRDISSEDELSLLQESEKCIANDILEHHIAIRPKNEIEKSHNYDPTSSKAENHRPISSSSNISSSSDTNGSNSSIGRTPALSDSTSGKSSPNNFSELFSNSKEDVERKSNDANFDNSCSGADAFNGSNIESKPHAIDLKFKNNEEQCNEIDIGGCKEESLLTRTASSAVQLSQVNGSDDAIIAIDLSKMNIFDDSNSFFSSAAMFQPTSSLKSQTANDLRQNHINGAVPHLPDLLNGIDGYLNNTIMSNEWEEAFQYIGMRNMKTIKGQLDHHQYNRQEQQKQHVKLHHFYSQQEEFLRIPNIHKQHTILNNMESSQIHAPHNDHQTIHNYRENQEFNRRSQTSLIQLQQLPQQHTTHIEDHSSRNTFGTNMLKFFDFHKNQQQQQINQQFQMHGQTLLNENVQLSPLVENSSINNFQSSDLSNGRFQCKGHLLKPRLFDEMPQQSQNQPTYQQPQQKFLQNSVTKESSHSGSVDDDLGFDPFIETQKALAELMEHEVVEKQTIHLGNTKLSGSVPILHQPQQHRQIPEPILLDNSQQRTRMPPPGFNHMNAFGFGVPRVQNTSNMIPNIANIAGAGPLNGEQDIQQNVQQISHTWGMSNFQQPQHSVVDQQHIHQMNSNANYNKAGYSHNDWTAMDPAILSLRQFSAFPLPPQTSHHSADIFMPNLPHQQQQNGQGFSTQPIHQANVNLANAALNSPQTSQAQVNANVQGMLEFLKTRQFV